MAVVFGYDDVQVPIVDHQHERTHQHQNFLKYLARKHTDPQPYPNYPDVDIRDAITHYLIEVEVPGIKDASEINCQWTSLKSLVVSGNTSRPLWKIEDDDATGSSRMARLGTGTRDAYGEYKPPLDSEPPYLLVGERKIGPFRRLFNFPLDVDMDKLSAKLEAGLLCIKVAKKGHAIPSGDGKVRIEVMD